MQAFGWYFFLYAFLGWCAEVAFAALKNGRFVNRGFLNGPLCPIYGVGLVGVLFCLHPMQNNLVLLYVGSVVLTTVVELITGYVMEKLFHQRWWDYSKMPLNIGGYVCLLFSLVWGIACVLIVRVVHPWIISLVAMMQSPWSDGILYLLTGLFITDLCVTVATVIRLNARLTQIDEIALRIREISNSIGSVMAEGVLAIQVTDTIACEDLAAVQQKAQHAIRSASEETREELAVRYRELVEHVGLGQRRILAAFPNLRSLRSPVSLRNVQEKLSQFRESRKRK